MHQDPLISLLLSTFVFNIPNLHHTRIYTLFSILCLAIKALLLLFPHGTEVLALESSKLTVSFYLLHSSVLHTAILPPHLPSPPLLPVQWEAQLQACNETQATALRVQQMCNSAGVTELQGGPRVISITRIQTQ